MKRYLPLVLLCLFAFFLPGKSSTGLSPTPAGMTIPPPVDTIGEVRNLYECQDSSITFCIEIDSIINMPNNQYQWFFAGSPLPSANDPCYTIPALDTLAEGSYHCEITDPSDTSQVYIHRPFIVRAFDLDTLNTKYYPDQIVVLFPEGTSQFVKDTVRARYQCVLLRECLDRLELWGLPSIMDVDMALIIDPEDKKDKVAMDAETEWVDWNYLVEEEWKPPLPGREARPARASLSMLPPPTTGHEVRLAIIDSGMDFNKPYLTNRLWTNPYEEANGMDDNCNFLVDDVNGYDFGDDDNDPTDDIGHGTLITALAAKASEDVADQVKIIPLKVFDSNNQTSLFYLTCAVLYSIECEVHVVNMSLGWRESRSGILDILFGEADDRCGQLFITSAGNDAMDNSVVPHFPSNYNDTLENVVAVGAVRFDGDLIIRPFYSAFGNDISPNVANVDLAAKDTVELSELPMEFDGSGFMEKAGTSLSSARVAGWAARLFAGREGAAYTDIKDCLLNNTLLSSDLTNFYVGGRYLRLGFSSGELPYLNCIAGLAPDTCDYLIDSCKLATHLFERKDAPEEIAEVTVFPQPSNGQVNVDFRCRRAGWVEIRFFDLTGKVRHQSRQFLGAGPQQYVWRPGNLAPGMYFFTIRSGDSQVGGKVLRQ